MFTCVYALVCVCVCLVSKWLCDLMDFSLPGSSVHGILQAKVLGWVIISFSRGSSQPRDRTQVSCVSSTGRWILYQWRHLGSSYVHCVYIHTCTLCNIIQPWEGRKFTHVWQCRWILRALWNEWNESEKDRHCMISVTRWMLKKPTHKKRAQVGGGQRDGSKMGEGQKVQTSSCQTSKFWNCNIQHGDCN